MRGLLRRPAELLDRLGQGPVDPCDKGWHLPKKLPLAVWLCAIAMFVTAYGFMWCYVHVRADMQPCLTRLPDPLFGVIPYDRAWYFVTHDIYEVLTILIVATFFLQALRGEHRPIVRFGTALAIQALLRSSTIVLLPLCRWTVEPGTIVLDEVPLLDLGIAKIPWRVWASNDLVFSGHVGEFVIITLIARPWPRTLRGALIVFQLVQAYALVATRGHYTVDVLLAVPCAYFANAAAVALLSLLVRFSKDATLPRPEAA